VERLPRRQASADHPLGQACHSCWHLLSQDEGPQTGRHFRLTVREAALTLVRVGEGLTLRSSSYKAREHAWPSADPRLPADVSDHAQGCACPLGREVRLDLHGVSPSKLGGYGSTRWIDPFHTSEYAASVAGRRSGNLALDARGRDRRDPASLIDMSSGQRVRQ